MILTTLKELVESNSAAAIILGILFFLITVGLIYFLYRRWFKEWKRIQDDKINYIEGLVSKTDLFQEMEHYITKIGRSGAFTLILLEITNYSDLISAFTERDANGVIIKISEKIRKTLPSTAMMTRFKENQFLILIKNLMEKDSVIEVITKIESAVEEPVKVIGNATINSTSSSGITFYPMHAESVKELLKNVNLSLYVARKNGRNNFVIFSESTQEKELNNLEYYQQITEGIKRKEFTLYYQPVVDIETKKVKSLESLLRWNHPTLGVIPPNKFLNIMEQSGDILWVGEWGFETLIKEYFDLKKAFPDRNFTCSINLSLKQLVDENLASNLVKIIRKYKVEPKNFYFEISDVNYYGKDRMLTANIDKIHELGFGIAIDGFGTDYGFLFNKSNTMPMDAIKLDRGFVSDIEEPMNKKLLQMIQQFATNKKLDVVALGVETQEMALNLLTNGVMYGQGYLYSPPISDTDLMRYLEDNSGDTFVKNELTKEENVNTAI